MKIIFIGLLLCLLACNSHQKESASDQNVLPITYLNLTEAKGFKVEETDSTFKILIQSLSTKYRFEDSLVYPKNNLSTPFKHLPKTLNRLACQSSTHLIFINALNKTEKVVGISDMKYMPKDSLYEVLMQNNVQEINKNGASNIEKLVAINPDVFFVYPFEWQSEKFKRVNIKTLLVSEYMEATPLARLEWIKFFGILLNETEKANRIYEEKATKYRGLQAAVDSTATLFFNLPFNELWDMPAPNSITGNLVTDAGYAYIYANESQNENDNLVQSKEKVWIDAMDANYWLIIANRPLNYSLNDLKNEAPIYKEFKAVKNKKVIFCNTAHAPYFTEGILEPDQMLRELIEIRDQDINYKGVYFQYLK